MAVAFCVCFLFGRKKLGVVKKGGPAPSNLVPPLRMQLRGVDGDDLLLKSKVGVPVGEWRQVCDKK